jgi:hypothetical protein
VYVTGTFDNWSKSEKLEKGDGIFQKTVTLPNAQDKIYYKVRSFFPASPSLVLEGPAPRPTGTSKLPSDAIAGSLVGCGHGQAPNISSLRTCPVEVEEAR